MEYAWTNLEFTRMITTKDFLWDGRGDLILLKFNPNFKHFKENYTRGHTWEWEWRPEYEGFVNLDESDIVGKFVEGGARFFIRRELSPLEASESPTTPSHQSIHRGFGLIRFS